MEGKDEQDKDNDKDDKDDLISVPHEPRLDHSIERGLKDPEELLLCQRNLASL